MKKNQKGLPQSVLKIGVGLVGIIIITLLIYYNNIARVSLEKNNTNTWNINKPTTMLPDTADWRTIAIRHWQFKVPKEWNYLDCPPSLFVGPQIKKDEGISCDNWQLNNMYISRQSKNALPEIPYTDLLDKESGSPVVKREAVKFGNKDGIKQTLMFETGEAIIVEYYIEHPNYIDTVRFSSDLLISKPEIVDQILSTFKFTDQSSSTDKSQSPGPPDIPSNEPPDITTYEGVPINP